MPRTDSAESNTRRNNSNKNRPKFAFNGGDFGQHQEKCSNPHSDPAMKCLENGKLPGNSH